MKGSLKTRSFQIRNVSIEFEEYLHLKKISFALTLSLRELFGYHLPYVVKFLGVFFSSAVLALVW